MRPWEKIKNREIRGRTVRVGRSVVRWSFRYNRQANNIFFLRKCVTIKFATKVWNSSIIRFPCTIISKFGSCKTSWLKIFNNIGANIMTQHLRQIHKALSQVKSSWRTDHTECSVIVLVFEWINQHSEVVLAFVKSCFWSPFKAAFRLKFFCLIYFLLSYKLDASTDTSTDRLFRYDSHIWQVSFKTTENTSLAKYWESSFFVSWPQFQFSYC